MALITLGAGAAMRAQAEPDLVFADGVPERFAPAIRAALADPEPKTRVLACALLRDYAAPGAEFASALEPLLLADGDPMVRAAALAAAAKVAPTPALVARLLELRELRERAMDSDAAAAILNLLAHDGGFALVAPARLLALFAGEQRREILAAIGAAVAKWTPAQVAQLGPFLTDAQPLALRLAAVHFARLAGETAKDFAPRLLELHARGDFQVRVSAGLALANLGRAAADLLGPALHDRDREVRGDALSILAGLGAAGAQHAQTVAGILQDAAESELTFLALQALAAMGEAARAQIPAVEPFAGKGPDPTTAMALRALVAMGGIGTEQLARRLGAPLDRDEVAIDPVDRGTCFAALGAVKDAAPAINLLCKQLRAGLAPFDRVAVHGSLLELAARNPLAVIQAIEGHPQPFAPDDEAFLFKLVERMAAAGPVQLVPLLGLASPPDLRRTLLAYLGEHPAAAMKIVDKVAVLLESGLDATTRERACAVLASIGPRAEPFVGAILRLLREPELRESAIHALARIGCAPGSAAALLTLARAADVASEPRCAALRALGHTRTPLGDVPRHLQQFALDETAEPGVRLAAITALGDLGPEVAASAEPLRALLASTNPGLRTAALTTIARIGEVAITLPFLADEDPQRRAAAGRGLLGREALPTWTPAVSLAPGEQHPQLRGELRFRAWLLSGASPLAQAILRTCATDEPKAVSEAGGAQRADLVQLRTVLLTGSPPEPAVQVLRGGVALLVRSTRWARADMELLQSLAPVLAGSECERDLTAALAALRDP